MPPEMYVHVMSCDTYAAGYVAYLDVMLSELKPQNCVVSTAQQAQQHQTQVQGNLVRTGIVCGLSILYITLHCMST